MKMKCAIGRVLLFSTALSGMAVATDDNFFFAINSIYDSAIYRMATSQGSIAIQTWYKPPKDEGFLVEGIAENPFDKNVMFVIPDELSKDRCETLDMKFHEQNGARLIQLGFDGKRRPDLVVSEVREIVAVSGKMLHGQSQILAVDATMLDGRIRSAFIDYTTMRLSCSYNGRLVGILGDNCAAVRPKENANGTVKFIGCNCEPLAAPRDFTPAAEFWHEYSFHCFRMRKGELTSVLSSRSDAKHISVVAFGADMAPRTLAEMDGKILGFAEKWLFYYLTNENAVHSFDITMLADKVVADMNVVAFYDRDPEFQGDFSFSPDARQMIYMHTDGQQTGQMDPLPLKVCAYDIPSKKWSNTVTLSPDNGYFYMRGEVFAR